MVQMVTYKIIFFTFNINNRLGFGERTVPLTAEATIYKIRKIAPNFVLKNHLFTQEGNGKAQGFRGRIPADRFSAVLRFSHQPCGNEVPCGLGTLGR